jgi:DNA-binding LacI/PurR family transcriptional regulator
MPDPAPRPADRTIAREAGVSPVTGSLCFHNHPSIPESTRERVRNVAKAQGYQLDPKIGKLMRHLRMRRRKNLSSNLVTLRIKSGKPEQVTLSTSSIRPGQYEAETPPG